MLRVQLDVNHAMLHPDALYVIEDTSYMPLNAAHVQVDVINARLLKLRATESSLNVLVLVKMVAHNAILITHARNAVKDWLSLLDNASPVVINVIDAQRFQPMMEQAASG